MYRIYFMLTPKFNNNCISIVDIRVHCYERKVENLFTYIHNTSVQLIFIIEINSHSSFLHFFLDDFQDN